MVYIRSSGGQKAAEEGSWGKMGSPLILTEPPNFEIKLNEKNSSKASSQK